MKENRSLAVMQEQHEAHDSFDDFPMPLWVARALCSYSHALKLQNAWEPVCDRGHMTEQLHECFGTAGAIDGHDYGYSKIHNIENFVGAFPLANRIFERMGEEGGNAE